MKPYKEFTRWWSDAYGGEYNHHCDFMMEEGDKFHEVLSDMTDRLKKVPRGKVWKVHLHFTYHEEDSD